MYPHTQLAEDADRVLINYPEIIKPLPGAQEVIDEPWSLEESLVLEHARTAHWVKQMLKAALAAEGGE